MEIIIKNRKLKLALEDEATCKRQYGPEMARKLMVRMGVLRAANSLMDFWPPNSGAERCHELTGDLAGQFSVDLKQPYRLLFVPADGPSKAECPNEKERWSAVKSVEILGIEDTHG